MQTSVFPTANRWLPTREEALRRMNAFVPRAGRTYAAQRNYDRGPGERSNVSTLSPFIRHRVLTERELLEAVLSRFTLSSAEKFVQEILWRTYWKGWLESHPSAWSRYQAALDERIAEVASDSVLGSAYESALSGRTGIDAFDAWAGELVTDNYLHNHARMWFASIWIFTLRLPWELGADFFLRNLVDGDPASNTLSWRWVAGLHTRGRAYTAGADNIRRYTEGRFELTAPLARSVSPLDEPAPELAQPRPVPPPTVSDEPSLLVLHDDDLHADLRELPTAAMRGVCAIRATHGRSPQPLNPAVSAFSDGVAREAATRAAASASARDFGLLAATERAGRIAELRSAADACGATRILTPFAPVGPARDSLDMIRADAAGEMSVSEAGRATLGYAEFGRRYDAAFWPAATRGFFNSRSRIPTILAELGIGAG